MILAMTLSWLTSPETETPGPGERDIPAELGEQLASLDPHLDPIVASILHRNWLERFRRERDTNPPGRDLSAACKPPRCFA